MGKLGDSFVTNKLLRRGFTTGSCATATAVAAAQSLLTQQVVSRAKIDTPSGISLDLPVTEVERNGSTAKYLIIKDSGDDPDITDGSEVFAKVSLIEEPKIIIDGGIGIGRITKKGLDQPVGAAAINSVPRQMISSALTSLASELGYNGGFDVIISIPAGVELAKRTFNPRLGIVGGISVLGTTGIVEPMSNDALIDTIKAEVSIIANEGSDSLLIIIGNFGEDFAYDKLGLKGAPAVKSSNFIGDAIAFAIENSMKKLFIVGHIGKMVKIGIGMFNTHSAYGDGRIETLISSAVESGVVDSEVLADLSKCISTDSAIEVLIKNGVLWPTIEKLAARIDSQLERRIGGHLEFAYICFAGGNLDKNLPDMPERVLCHSKNTLDMLEHFKKLTKKK